MGNKGQSTTVIIQTATLHAGTCTRSRVITYSLDSSSSIHEAMQVEETAEYHSDHTDGYTLCRYMHKE